MKFNKIKYLLLIIIFLTFTFSQQAYCTITEEKEPSINALAAVVIEMNTGRVLYSKNATERRSIASTTKIMTAIVALEKGDLDDEVEISKKAAWTNGSTIGVQTGQVYTLKELLYALLMSSANDAAVAIAEHIGGTVEGFAELMNSKAKSLGMEDSHFVTPHGLDTENQYSTAYDLAILTRYALNNEIFSRIVATTDYRITGHGLFNTNDLLAACPGVDGVKTGYTGKAGRCLVTTALRDGMRVISVVLGSPTRSARAYASRDLLDFAFRNYKMYRIMNMGDKYAEVPVKRGVAKSVVLKTDKTIELPLSEKEAGMLKKTEYVPEILNAPVYAGIEAGFVKYSINDEVIAENMLTISENVRRKNYVDYLNQVFGEWVRVIRESIFLN